jgi:hypothetical protein
MARTEDLVLPIKFNNIFNGVNNPNEFSWMSNGKYCWLDSDKGL